MDPLRKDERMAYLTLFASKWLKSSCRDCPKSPEDPRNVTPGDAKAALLGHLGPAIQTKSVYGASLAPHFGQFLTIIL